MIRLSRLYCAPVVAALVACGPTPPSTAPRGSEAPATTATSVPPTRAKAAGPDVPAKPSPERPGSSRSTHCKSDEHTVFSCTLEGTPQVISLCIAERGDAQRYIAGPIGAPDATFAGSIQRTTLGFAGGTGGYAYSFVDGGQSHVLYAISGESGLARSGEILADTDLNRTMHDRACDAGSLIESDDLAVLRRVRAWGPNARLESKGLPPQSP